MEFLEVYDVLKILNKEDCVCYYDNDYIGIYFSLDVYSFHVFRVLKDYNSQYEVDKGVFLLEYNKIPKYRVGKISSIKQELKRIAEADQFLENWDVKEYFDYEVLLEDIKGGYVEDIITSI